MKKKSIGTRILDVFTYAPGSLKKNVYTLPVNIIIMGMVLIRCISVGYFVLGLVWKLHTGLIKGNWIEILNRLWIGDLRLGVTVNALVLNSVALFPVYILSGTFGLMGIICRKQIFLILYMVSLLFFLVTDVIYISLFSILVNGMESSVLAADFQAIFKEFADFYQTTSQNDVKGIKEDWLDMFTTLGCCGVTSNLGSYMCTGYDSRNTCWGKFSNTMTSYCSTYLSLAVLCFVNEMIQLSFCDIVYSQLFGKRLPFALARTCISKLRKAWKRSWSCVLANLWRVLSCIPAISLLCLGVMLRNDNQMTGAFVEPIYTYIYLLGLNFIDIIDGLSILMIVLGCLELFVNLLSLTSDLVVHSKIKSIVIIVVKSFMMTLKIIWLGLVINLVVQMNKDLRIQMAHILRNYSNIKRNWYYLFGELQCCGLTSRNDLIYLGLSSAIPYTCCHYSLYQVSSSLPYTSNCNIIQTGCLDKVLEVFTFYTTGFFIAVSILILFGGLTALFTIIEVRSLRSEDLHDKQVSEKDELKDTNSEQSSDACTICIKCCKSDKLLSIQMLSIICCVIFGFALVTEGIFLTYDKVFNNRSIKDILLSALSFEGLSFTHIRKSLCAFMFASGITLIITSGFGIFTPRTKSKCLHITQAVVIGIVLTLIITGMSLWGKIKDTISYKLDAEMYLFLDLHGYYEQNYLTYTSTANGAWNYLFAVAECCGVNYNDGSDFEKYMHSGNKVPVFCCKENPLTEPYRASNDACQKNQEWDLQHNSSCKDALLTRLDTYSNTFFSFGGLIIFCLIIQLALILYQLRKRQFLPRHSDKYSQLFKTKKGFRQILVFEWRTLFAFLSLLASVSVLVLGIVMKLDSRMTGNNVYYIYTYLYFKGVNFHDIVQAMNLSLITLGVLSMCWCLVGLSETFTELRSTTKTKLYVAVLFILILTKLVCVFLMIPVQMEINTYSNKTYYQLENLDRQYSNPYSNIYGHLDNFYFEFDCCGSTGSEGFNDLVNSAGYGPIYGFQPLVCCYGKKYGITQSLHTLPCEKKACGAEFVDVIVSYCNGLIASMSVTTFFEIICLVFSMHYLLNNLKQETQDKSCITKFIFVLFGALGASNKTQWFGFTCACFIQMVAVGHFAESAALLYDEIFANRQIQPLFDQMFMIGNSFNQNLIIMRWLMNTSGFLLFISSTLAILTIHRGSKFLHSMNILLCVLAMAMIIPNMGWWIAVHVVNFPDELLRNSVTYFYSRLPDGYTMEIDGAWNNLFVKLKCCGYTTGNSSDFKYVQFQRNPFNNELTSLFCCHSNPLTEVYNGDYTCATLAGTDRYTEPCSAKLSERLLQHSIAFYVIASLSLVLEVVMVVVLAKLIQNDAPFRDDPVLWRFGRKYYYGKNRKGKKILTADENNITSETALGTMKENTEDQTENFNTSVSNEMQNSKDKTKYRKRRSKVTPLTPKDDLPAPRKVPQGKLPSLTMSHN
ncbi:uncharacterized protein LOC125651286 [Ostrea edulis]|uniref:uncharacterized protein LOC125651286 n=1 Tax=Ostrea edulis TaxID=37623 RepID=UPI0024AFBF5B|nr:uncharacterized protein LOC125651286 [Ostrea edulis]